MKKMLINATHSEEIRVAILDIETQELVDLIYEKDTHQSKIGNIYKARITSLESSLDAVFLDYGAERHGFLPFKEVSPEYFKKQPENPSERMNLNEALEVGQEILVQLEKEERGTKGAAFTSFISLAGSYLVLMPNNPRAGGISRRIEGNERDEMRDILNNLQIPDSMGIILRTAGVGKSMEELQWDLNLLMKKWEEIQAAAARETSPVFIHQDSDMITRALRDYLRQDINEIWVDNPPILEKVKQYIAQVRPEFVERVKLYDKIIPLFNYYQIEHQIEAAHQREVRLKSGGSIVIDHSEALVAIDVNSSKATKGSDIEDTAVKTNKEAAERIAKELRIRDLGGLIVIDFIDMSSSRHQREVENVLREAVKQDRARVRIGHISQFGLLEMSRQRLRPSLGESSRVICPRCVGWGTIRSVESLGLSIMRIIKEDAIKANVIEIQVTLPIDVAMYISNEKREQLSALEKEHEVRIIVIPNKDFLSPHYQIKSVTENERAVVGQTSYKLLPVKAPETQEYTFKRPARASKTEQPAVQSIYSHPSDLGSSKKAESPSLFKRIIASVFGSGSPEQPEKLEEEISIAKRIQSGKKPVAQSRPFRQQGQGQAQTGPVQSRGRGSNYGNKPGNRRRNPRNLRKRNPRTDFSSDISAEPYPLDKIRPIQPQPVEKSVEKPEDKE